MHKEFWPWYISICDIDIQYLSLEISFIVHFHSLVNMIRLQLCTSVPYIKCRTKIDYLLFCSKKFREKITKTGFQLLILFPYKIWSKWNAFQGFKWQYFMIQVIMLNHFYSFIKMKPHDVQKYSLISKNRKIFLVFSAFPYFAHGSFWGKFLDVFISFHLKMFT